MGSNIDKEKNLSLAVELLAANSDVVAISSAYETRPVGFLDQDNFLNAAVLLHTTQSPEQLKLGLLDEIERKLGRVRQIDKNAPRTIDLDISWYDDDAFDYEGPDGVTRHLPDPDMLRFAHVAIPVAELLPDNALIPGTNQSVHALSEQFLEESASQDSPTIWPRPDVDLARFNPSLKNR